MTKWLLTSALTRGHLNRKSNGSPLFCIILRMLSRIFYKGRKVLVSGSVKASYFQCRGILLSVSRHPTFSVEASLFQCQGILFSVSRHPTFSVKASYFHSKGILLIWIIVVQGSAVLTFRSFSLIFFFYFFLFSLSLLDGSIYSRILMA